LGDHQDEERAPGQKGQRTEVELSFRAGFDDRQETRAPGTRNRLILLALPDRKGLRAERTRYAEWHDWHLQKCVAVEGSGF
jgi:hypothetical protein